MVIDDTFRHPFIKAISAQPLDTTLETAQYLIPDTMELPRVLKGEAFGWIPQLFSNPRPARGESVQILFACLWNRWTDRNGEILDSSTAHLVKSCCGSTLRRLLRGCTNIDIVYPRMTAELLNRRDKLRTDRVRKLLSGDCCGIRARSDLISNVPVCLCMFGVDRSCPDYSNSHPLPPLVKMCQWSPNKGEASPIPSAGRSSPHDYQ
jgi:hypothetical protein